MKDIQPAPPTRCTCGHKRAIEHTAGGGPCRLCKCRIFIDPKEAWKAK